MSEEISYVKPILLSTEQAADYLSVSTQTVKKLAHEGQIPVLKIGALYKFNLMELDRFIFENTTKVERSA